MIYVRKIVVRALDRLRAWKRMRSWKVPTELCPIQMFPSHIRQFFSNIFVDPTSLANGRQILLNSWSSKWLVRLHQLKVKMLLGAEYRSIEVTLKESDILHPDAVRGVCTAEPVEKGSIVGYHWYCIWIHEFWWMSLWDVWREHNKGDERAVFELGKSTSADDDGQELGTDYCVDWSSSDLCDALCERHTLLPRGQSARKWEGVRRTEEQCRILSNWVSVLCDIF